jgi:hypothetical protein
MVLPMAHEQDKKNRTRPVGEILVAKPRRKFLV